MVMCLLTEWESLCLEISFSVPFCLILASFSRKSEKLCLQSTPRATLIYHTLFIQRVKIHCSATLVYMHSFAVLCVSLSLSCNRYLHMYLASHHCKILSETLEC